MTARLCSDCGREPVYSNGLGYGCLQRHLADEAERRRAAREAEDIRIDAAFDRAKAVTIAAYALPEYEHGSPSGRELLSHPECLELVNGEGVAVPLTTRQVIEEHADTPWVCAGCGGNVLDPARRLGVALEPEDEFARPRGAA